MRTDLKLGPRIHKITHLPIPPVDRLTLPNGVTIYFVNMGTQNLVQLEVLYKGGRLLEKKKGVSRAVGRLVKEGTASYTGAEIAETIDFYGANISSGDSLDYSFIKVFVLNKYFEDVLPIFQEVLFQPIFPEKELSKYKDNCIQKLKVELAKSELVAYKTITEKIYGSDHVYGYNSTEEIYESLTTDDLHTHFSSYYAADNCTCIVSGNITEEVKHAVMSMFSQREEKGIDIVYDPPMPYSGSQSIRIPAVDQVQSAVKIGCRLFKRDHPDFPDMFILNTILGGYFGSRLMTSLREEKGYTYNIYSSVDMMIHDGYFNVSTEVGNEYLTDTLDGIYAEMKLLQETPVGEEELNMVKNYLSGNFLNMVDGPFKVAGLTKVIALNGLTFDFYGNLMQRIHNVSAEDLQKVAQRYLNKEDMIEVIVS